MTTALVVVQAQWAVAVCSTGHCIRWRMSSACDAHSHPNTPPLTPHPTTALTQRCTRRLLHRLPRPALRRLLLRLQAVTVEVQRRSLPRYVSLRTSQLCLCLTVGLVRAGCGGVQIDPVLRRMLFRSSAFHPLSSTLLAPPAQSSAADGSRASEGAGDSSRSDPRAFTPFVPLWRRPATTPQQVGSSSLPQQQT